MTATYLTRLTEAMTLLSLAPNTLFLGQAIKYPGTGMTQTFQNIPPDRLIELPVFENTQLGMCTGLSLAGYLPIAVFPRMNFLLCAIDQLVLHLDALPRYSTYRPKVLIRTAVASPTPLDPGTQHLGDYTEAITSMLKTVKVEALWNPSEILPAYRRALAGEGSTILVEYTCRYDVTKDDWYDEKA